MNTAIYDWDFDTPETVSLLREMGTLVLRFPAAHCPTLSLALELCCRQQLGGLAHLVHQLRSCGHEPRRPSIITANYGTGTPDEAADWCATPT